MDYAKSLALYEKLVATKPAVERKGDTMPYTSLNGHMFSVLDKDGTVALRLDTADREAFLKKYKASQPVMYGMVMKEYVAIPESLLAKTSELAPFFESSHRYVATLKPKATKRPKKSAPTKATKAKVAKAAKSAKPARTR